MNQENKKLGRGLSSLLSSNENYINNEKLKYLNTSSLIANKEQPRKNFDKNELKDLAVSIRAQGILQPIIVRKSKTDPCAPQPKQWKKPLSSLTVKEGVFSL